MLGNYCVLQVCGFDLVEDEAVVDHHLMDAADLLPAEWTGAGNPGFAYYCYYVYSNLVSLNQLRRFAAARHSLFRRAWLQLGVWETASSQPQAHAIKLRYNAAWNRLPAIRGL